MNLIGQFRLYFSEIVSLFYKNRFVILLFLAISVIAEFFYTVSVPFVSIFLLIFLMFYLSRTEEYKKGNWKIFKFFLFFIILFFFIMLFLIPGVIMLNMSQVLSAEQLLSSGLLATSAKIGGYASVIFIFAPYRIFDANEGVLISIKYSYDVIINNIFLFISVMIFLFALNYVNGYVEKFYYFSYFIDVICTVTIYRLNIKKSSYKDEL